MDYNKRENIEKNYKWDLTTRYQNDSAWEKDYSVLKKQIKNILSFKSNLNNNIDNLYNCLEEYFSIHSKLLKLYVYASCKSDENLDNSKYSLMDNKAYSLFSEFSEYSSFITPEILKFSKEYINKILKHKKLSKYKFYLENIFRFKEHTLSANEEALVAKLTQNDNLFHKINSILIDSVIEYGTIKVDGKMITLTNSNYRNIMTSTCRKTRMKAYQMMNDNMKKYSNIFAESLIGNMKNTWTLAQIRNFKDTLSMELFSSNLPKKVVSNLYDNVHQRLDVFQNYLEFLRKNLGLNKLKFYDLSAEFLNSKMTFSIEDAQNILLNAFKIYDEDYYNLIKQAFTENWIDYGSYKGKRSGAYCTFNYGNTPLVLTNFHGKFVDIGTLAHELGHAVHFYLGAKNNYYHESENDIFVAEIASLTNEIILADYIVKTSKDKDLKLIALNYIINTIQNNLFDACLEGELENEIYSLIEKGEGINSEILNNRIYDIRKRYYGNQVDLDDNVKYMWARRAHYFYPYYLYKYATGVCAAIYIATKIINNDQKMKKDYLKFLTKGETDYPINILKNIGIDMTSPNVINNAIDYFEYLIEEFNKVSDE